MKFGEKKMNLKGMEKLGIPSKIALSFLVIILAGSVLLSLPISNLETSTATYFDQLFMAVSMVCVTGLAVVPVVSTYTLFGQIVSLVLIQIGGLGLMTIIAVLIIQAGRKVSYSNMMAIQEALNLDKIAHFKKFMLSIIRYTIIIEGTAFLLLTFQFVPEFGWSRGLFTSLYIAISAFCNAGFDNIGTTSLQAYAANPLINSVVSSLIILGGIGFSVWFDVVKNTHSILKNKQIRFGRLFKKLLVHTRLVLVTTLILLIFGWVFFLVAEWNMPSSIGHFSIFGKVVISFFQSVTMRTAGFATIDYTQIRTVTMIMFFGLMFIGGSPGGTAGGVKTTTFALLSLLFYNEIKGQEYINYQYHTISMQLVRKAIVIIMASFMVLLIGVGLLVIFEPNQPVMYVAFEAVSALATVGVSVNLTPELSTAGQAVIMVMMFIGRIGPITLFLILAGRRKKVKDTKFAEGDILIG